MTTQATRAGAKPIIIDPERMMRQKLSHSEHFVFRIDASVKDRLRDTFLVLPSSTLNKYAVLLIRSMKELPNLRVVFVLMDTGFDAFFDKVAELKVSSSLSKMFRVDQPEQIDRVLHAWCDGLQRSRFADARIEGSNLLVKACDLSKHEIDLSTLPIFANINVVELQKPTIDPIGTRLTWKNHHIDLDFDTVRYQADAKYRMERDLSAVAYYSHYGDAVRTLREQLKLTQEDIAKKTGFSARHLSRIENGEQRPTGRLVAELASAHRLPFDDYIKKLLHICDQMEGRSLERRRLRKRTRSK